MNSPLAGRLTLRPGAAEAVVCARPIVGAPMMKRLTEGRRATLLPDLLATVFTLCAEAQRATSRRAVRAAFGLADSPADAARDALTLALTTAREHLQRLALDLPTLVPADGVPADPGWMRDAPVMSLPQRLAGSGDVLRSVSDALPGWLERRLFGMPVAEWLQAWQAGHGDWLQAWSQDRTHPVARWLQAVQDEARACVLPCRALGLVAEVEAGWRTLAAGLAADPQLAERPRWQGLPAETGPWTRAARSEPVATAWDRLGARLADLAHIALHGPAPLACGALAVAPGEGIAWSEMSRGLLVHWVRLESGDAAVDVARAEVYRVIAPTEWNFHPDGALAAAIARATPPVARLVAATLDPCLAFEVEPEVHDA